MGGQFSNPNANIAQEYINELTTRRARGGNPGADLPKLTLNQKKYFESQIKYLGAHGAYDKETQKDIIHMPKLTFIHLTAHGSSLNVGTDKYFFDLSLEQKYLMLKNPAYRKALIEDLGFGIDTERGQGVFAEHKNFGQSDRLEVNIFHEKIPNIKLQFYGEIGDYNYFKSGLFDYNDSNAVNLFSNNIARDKGVALKEIKANASYADKVLKQMLSKDRKIQEFFQNKLKSGIWGDDVKLMNVASTDLRELYDNKVLPESGVIILLSCRFDFDKGQYSREQFNMDIAPLGATMDYSLDDQCSQTTCAQRLQSFDPFALQSGRSSIVDGDIHCKISGKNCSTCNISEDKCISCKDSKSVIILLDGKNHSDCLMCFTPQEILNTAEKYIVGIQNVDYPDINEHIYPSIPNPIYPGCQINIKILKMILIMYGNREQIIFREVISKKNLIDFLYIILCFKYTDEEECIEGLNHVLSNTTILEDVPTFVTQLKINGFLKSTFHSIMNTLEAIYNSMESQVVEPPLKVPRSKSNKERRKRPY